MKATAAFFCLAFSILLSVVSIGLATWLAIWSFGAPPRSNGNSNSNGSSKGGNSISNNNWTFRRIHGGANIAWAVYELGWLVLYLLPSTRAALAAARRRHHQRDENGNNEGEKNRAELAVSPSVEQLRRVGRRHGGIVWSIGLLITVVRIFSGAGSVFRPPGFSAQKRLAYGVGFGVSVLVQFLCLQRNAWWNTIHQALVDYASDKEREVALDVEHEAEAANQARLNTLRQAQAHAAGNPRVQFPA
ncbi:hypothetical protein OC844_007854 [Tilletia horrida]|nr:hypothetical protein OC844_007854 [Tilletia horrida]